MATTVELRGTYQGTSGLPLRGQVKFIPRVVAVMDAAGNVIMRDHPIIATLDNSGEFTLALQATDDPTIAPQGWTYKVVETVGGAVREYDIDVPVSAAGPGIDLADIAPVPISAGDPTAFPTLSAFEALQAQADLTSNPPAVRVQRSSPFPVTSEGYAEILFDAEVYDTDNMFTVSAPDRLTIRTPGLYSVGVILWYSPNSTGGRWVEIVRNGTDYIGSGSFPATPLPNSSSVSITTHHMFAVDDFIQFFYYQDSGATLDIEDKEQTSPVIFATRLGSGP